MAKIKLNAGSQISGTIGGNVYASNKGGQYVKAWRKPVQPRTSYQTGMKLQMSFLSQYWRTLQPLKKVMWSEATDNYPTVNRLGESKKLSGAQLFNQLNANLIQAGVPPVGTIGLDVPLIPVPIVSIDTGFTATMSKTASTAVITYGADIDVNTEVLIFASAPMSKGKAIKSANMRFIGILPNSTVSPFSYWSMYIAKFGTPQIGGKIGLELVCVSNITGAKLPALQKAVTIV